MYGKDKTKKYKSLQLEKNMRLSYLNVYNVGYQK